MGLPRLHPLPGLFHSALAFEVTSSQYQAHYSYGTKNDEDDALHGVIFFLKSRSWHWNPPFLWVTMLAISTA